MEIIGQKKIISLLEREARDGSCAQAYIFSGPKGVGKFALAKEFSCQIVLGKNFSALSEEERSKAALDIILVEPESEEKKGIIKEKEISLEQILEARRELANFPYHGKMKVLIINKADRMTLKAQNALLKITEEPNSTSVIILVASRAGKILATIQSRCQKINFPLVARGELEEYLQSRGEKIDPEILEFSMGRSENFLELLSDPERAVWFRDSREKFSQAVSGSIIQKLKLAEELSKNVPEAIRHLEFWLWESHSRGEKDLGRAEKIVQALESIENTNASPRLILENLFLNF